MKNPTTFTINISWNEIESAYKKRLEKAVSEAEIKGFRKGKAPVAMVQELVGKKKILSGVVEDVLPVQYQKQLKQRKLVPMIAPRVKPLVMDEKKDWKFEIVVVSKPEVDLGDYQEKIKQELAPGKIIKPNQEKQSKTKEQIQSEKMRIALDTLLSQTKVELPAILVEEEVNLRLSKLLDQVASLGMTIEAYLKAKGLTQQSIKAEYEKTAREMLTLNLALDKIASLQKFEGKDRISQAIEWLISL